ncbi:MAG: ATP12 ATPase [Candidatus Tokpelaia hoelldobleri]|uniref:ATP12 ATPase n=1 Tax=Candidatus Tokpelaia hoelldobleri TaxID=1902579 RepID=A0A1U9JUI6_9HYPH|nr:MAG: ATP12 ATPase [Candidatus Tokpelaia hoelldoblerii]
MTTDREKAVALARPPLPKRFYKVVSVARQEGGFAVLLDGRPVKTPARHALLLPAEALANLVADEFRLQDAVIDPAKMPITRLVNTVVDGIAADPQPVLEDMLRFAANDMLFYRAESPKELVARQSGQWDAVLDWAQSHIGAHFVTGAGMMHIEQPREAVAAVSVYLRQYISPFSIAALHAITTLTGSALLALAIAAGELDVATGWRLAHLEEDWTIEHWGEDEEAAMRRRNRENELYAAAAVLAASRG